MLFWGRVGAADIGNPSQGGGGEGCGRCTRNRIVVILKAQVESLFFAGVRVFFFAFIDRVCFCFVAFFVVAFFACLFTFDE